ncbi:MAG TPA: delta-60 repeat domain-containing protein [Usitatibacter sp.]|nr:delta-60 repeat domain-containing protein [Usitatibacter sp.]
MVRPHIRNVLACVALLACFAASTASAQIPVRVQATAQQPDGKIVYAGRGNSSQTMILGRLNADGTKDDSFGYGSGWINYYTWSYSFDVKSIAVLADGKILVAALRENQVALARFESNGDTDMGFGSGYPVSGMVTDSLTGLMVNAIVANADGTVLGFGGLSGGGYYSPSTAAVVRYNADGTRDMAFGNNGNGVFTNPNYMGIFNAATPLPGGGIAAAGHWYQGYRKLLVARFAADGTIDPSFGMLGWAWGDSDYETPYEDALAISVDSAGNLVAVGSARRDDIYYPVSYSRMMLVRLAPSGTILQTIRRDVLLPPSSQLTDAKALAVLPLPDGDYAIAGTVAALPDSGPDGYAFLTRAYSGVTVILPRPANYVSEFAGGLFASPTAGQVIYLGSLDGYYSPSLHRARYFADNFDFDIDYSTEWNPYDTDPNPIAIPPVEGALPDTLVTSALFRVTGINQPTMLSVSYAGEISLGCTEPFTADPVIVNNGDRACVRVMTGSTAGITTSVTIQAGNHQAIFSVSTVGAPDTLITQAPAPQAGPYALIRYDGTTVSGPITGYECRVDNDPFTWCPANNHVQVGPLGLGPHTFEVRALNAYGADSTPAMAWWTVVAPPETTITSGPPPVTNGGPVTFTFTSSLEGALFLCNFNHPNAYEPCTSPKTYPFGQVGANLFRVYAFREATDYSPAEWSFTVDVTPPDTHMTFGPEGPYTFSATSTFNVVSPTDANATFQCSLDSGAWYACGSGPTVSVTVSPGAHVLQVRAVDAVGNVDPTPTSRGWTYEFRPVDTSITSGPMPITSSTTANLAYTSTRGTGSVFTCSLTGPGSNGATETCPSSGRSYSFLGDGTWTFRVFATSGGETDPTPAEHTWTIDTIAPSVALSTPGGTVNNASAAVQFMANESGVTFACSLDNAPFAPCTSPLALTGLADGYHLFNVRGTDLAGNQGFALRDWFVDVTGPDTSITSGPSGAVAVAAAQFAFTSNEAGSSFQCSLDGAAFSACTSPASYAGLADGAHSFAVRATDAVGNVDPSPATASWTVDTSAPDTIIDTGPSGTTGQSTAAFTFHASEAGTTFECSLDSAAFAACAPGVSYAGVGNGMHLFEVRARDSAANADATPASRTWSVDLTQPATTITSGPSAITASGTATFAFTSSEAGTFLCSLDGAPFSACTTPVSYGPLASGSHAFAVYAVDNVGNADASPATWSWIVDTQAPETTITAKPAAATNQASASFGFSASESGSTFECKLDAGAFAACTSPRAYSGLAVGSHTFQVRATDSLGNQDASPASFTWVIDTTAPDTTLTGGPTGNTNPNTATFTFAATEAGSTFECKLDTAAFVACASGVTYNGLAKGSHTFQVRATDAAGNVDASPATRTWKVN